MKYAWIEAQRDGFCVDSMGRLLGVAKSGLDDWRSRAQSPGVARTTRAWLGISAHRDRPFRSS